MGDLMKLRYATLLISVLVLITSCKDETQRHEEPVVADPTPQYEYKVGLGYGFLGKVVQVTIDGREMISIVGTDEIEQYAQLQGTKMLASGSSPKKDITVRVTVDGGQPHEQAIDLSAGMFVHVYLERTELRVYNTRFLVQE
ncbi:MAG: hypothetical protein KAS38_16680 [Anaerolineales bacterium]|nr:hypothetical protein [Anaerolineales bacterium]